MKYVIMLLMLSSFALSSQVLWGTRSADAHVISAQYAKFTMSGSCSGTEQ